MTTLLDGKLVASKIREQIHNNLNTEDSPILAVILVGNDPASLTYVTNKSRACEDCGISYKEYRLPEITQTGTVIDLITRLNNEVDGILVQLPLPKHIDTDAVIQSIEPNKDVDGFTVGSNFTPCTPKGIMTLLNQYNIDVSGKHVVIIGRSDIVGKPLARLMLNADATVTVCHSKTNNLSEFTKQADILVSAVGKSKLITADMVKPGAVVIDVGINRDESGKLAGDVDFDAVYNNVTFITPVPGGIGPMTIASLMENVYESYTKRRQSDTKNTYK